MKDIQKIIREKVEEVTARNDMVWAMDNSYRLTAFNCSFGQRIKDEDCGEAIVGMDLEPIYASCEFFKICLEGCQKALEGEATTTVHMFSGEGNNQFHEFTFQPYMKVSKEVIGCCVWQRNITKEVQNVLSLEESERRYKEVQEVADVGHWIWDMENDVIYWSDQLYAIWGKEKGSFDLNYDSVVGMVHPEDRVRFLEHLEECVQGKVNHDITHRLLLDGGIEKYIHSKGHVFRDADGNPNRMSGTAQDVTKDVQSHQKILEQNIELQNFVRIVSHNLRAPISNLLMLSKIYDWGKDGNNDEVVQNMERTVEALDNTVKDLNNSLSFKSSVKEKFSNVSLTEVYEDVKTLLSWAIDETQANIEVDFSEVDQIIAVKSYMSNILYNLLLNAMKYTREGISPEIKASTAEKDGRVLLQVSDNGIGMDLTPERKARIFDMYGRLSGKTRGKGMGLFLVKTQIEAMDCTIDVVSQKNVGSTFTVSFRK
ncbi:sensor histidine kinase [Flagellimonas oceanensis]|nr:PAS domain-containing sensor histidine kinase [Allomuricauda oceanensis]|tara:strand:- start:1985 stop:3436 length:1452 start_codon:yes stop_codon:yes gene_type:complete